MPEAVRPAIYVDPAELALAEADPEAGLSLDASETLVVALAEHDRRVAAEAPVRAALLRAEWSDETRKVRRSLLASSLVGLAVAWAGLVPDRASLGGVRFEVGDADRLLLLLLGVVAYFLVAFCAYALADVAKSRVLGHAAAAARDDDADASAEQSAAESAILRTAGVIARRRAERRRQRALQLWGGVSHRTRVATGLLDYALPLGVGGWALVELVLSIL